MIHDLSSIQTPFSNEIQVDGRRYLYFGGTAYLGIPQNQEFIDLYLRGIKLFGLNNGTSRNNNIQLGIYNDAEKVAAKRYGSEEALITSSGYLAAQLAVQTLSRAGTLIYAPNTHPALWLNQQPQISCSFKEWKNETIRRLNGSEKKDWVIISNSMNNLVPEIYDFSFLNEVDPEKNIVLIIDDSHGIGVNHDGSSAWSVLPKKRNIECVVLASMAKALGVDAGLILGGQKTISKLKDTNIFAGASPPSAAGLYAFIHAELIYQNTWNALQQNIRFLAENLNSSWQYESSFPAFLIDDPEIDQYFLKDNILISSFPYPDRSSKPINRIVLSSWHETQDIQRLIHSVSKR